MKKMLSVLTAGLMAASLFVACDDGGTKNTGSKPGADRFGGVEDLVKTSSVKVPDNAVRNWTAELAEENSEWAVVGVEDLQKLSELVNAGTYNFGGDTVLLLNDIIINKKVITDTYTEPLEADVGGPTEGLVNLNSIGMRDKPFCGDFDGQGHIIWGYYSYQAHQGLGFFGVISNAVVKNLILVDSCVINMNTGGGDNSDDDRFGGLVGMVVEPAGSEIENCVFVGVVGSDLALKRGEPYEYIGGLVGRCDAAATATNCFVLAKVYGDADVVCKKGAENLTKTDVDGYALDASSDFAALEEAINYIKSIQ